MTAIGIRSGCRSPGSPHSGLVWGLSRLDKDGPITVIPAQAGIQSHGRYGRETLGPRLRGDDERGGLVSKGQAPTCFRVQFSTGDIAGGDAEPRIRSGTA